MKQKDVVNGASKMLGVNDLNIENFEKQGLDDIGVDDVDKSLLEEGDINFIRLVIYIFCISM